MPTSRQLEAKFWKALASDMTMMLGLVDVDSGHSRPMTAQLGQQKKGPIWFFTTKDSLIVKNLKGSKRAVATFVSKGHNLFATVHGRLRLDTDKATIDKLWNRFVAAWYEDGKDDPKLALLRLDSSRAEIWLDDSSLFAGVKMFFGIDPKEDYKGKIAKVKLSRRRS